MVLRNNNKPDGSGFMLWKIALVYMIGILISEPVYIWAIRTLTKMEDEDERLYCSDNGEWYEPGKPNNRWPNQAAGSAVWNLHTDNIHSHG